MCGFGEGRKILQQPSCNIEYCGFDYSEEVVSLINKEEPSLHIHQADATTIELEENQYDIIILIGGLHHVPRSASDVIRRLVVGLKPGGYFINLEPTHGNFLFRIVREFIYRRNSLFDEETEQAFSVDELKTMFEKAQLEERYISYPGLLSYVLFYNPDAFGILNRGPRWFVDFTFAIDRVFYRTWIGRTFSFATLSVWVRPELAPASSSKKPVAAMP
jgi:SAM-dependent methyltransferase